MIATDKQWFFVSLPLTDYIGSKELQNRIVSAKASGNCNASIVLWLEHYPVFTLGRHRGMENLKVSKSFLHTKQIPVVSAERGGSITYHGPGQLVVYPVIDLQTMRLGAADYINRLEQIMIQTANDFHVQTTRNSMNRGVWCGNKKLGSVGIAIRKGISFHGFALNVDISLEPFQWINPCGLENIMTTSLKKEAGIQISKKQVRKAAQKNFVALFDIDPVNLSLKEFEKLLNDTCTFKKNNAKTCLA